MLDDPQQIKKFAYEVIQTINVNLEDPESEMPVYVQIIENYARISKITPNEFFQARICLARGLLRSSTGEILKAWKKIDFEMFIEMEEAYIRYKRENKAYENGIAQIKAFLSPVEPKLTQAQKDAQKEALIDRVKNDIMEDGKCEYAFIVYDYLLGREDFADYRAEFPQVYDQTFREFIVKQKLSEKSYFTKTELTNMVAGHDAIMDKLNKKEPIKKREFPGAPLQMAKNKIVINYFK